MIPESYLTLWGGIDVLVISLAKVYAFKALSGMLGELKINKGIYNILGSILLVAVILVKFSSGSIPILALLGISSLWVVLTISYNSSIVQRWIVLVSWVSAVITAEAVLETMIYAIYNISIFKSFVVLRITYSIGIMITVLLLKGQVSIYKRLEICIINNKWAGATTLIPLVINDLSIVIMFSYFRSSDIRIEAFGGILLAITCGILLANTTIVISASRLSKFYEAEMERREEEERSEAEYTYYSRLEEEQERIRLLYHDINNHIACIKEVAKEEGNLTEYIHALEKDVQMTTQTYKTGCSVVDAILRQKSIVCERNHIELKVNLNLSACEFVEDKDLCSIFANALDNAIEACGKITNSYTEKYIHVESRIVKGFLVIKIKNSKEHMNKWINDLLVTHKKDKRLHGLGLKNIKRALEKYKGEYIIKEESNVFYLKLVIPLQSSKM